MKAASMASMTSGSSGGLAGMGYPQLVRSAAVRMIAPATGRMDDDRVMMHVWIVRAVDSCDSRLRAAP